MRLKSLLSSSILLIGVTLSGAAWADASCHGGAGFPQWLGQIKGQAARQGFSPRTLAVLDGLTPDPKVLNQDRGQPSLSQSFLQFSDRMVTSDRLSKGRGLIAANRQVLSRVERDYGVPGPVLVALWGFETNFGTFQGSFDTLRALATLGYDCRRPDFFTGELMNALRLIDRGDLSPAEMKGAWAGELGQTQFIPSRYLEFAVDYDGDGRRDLVRSVPDVLASTANYLRSLGWKRGQPWLEEVRVSDTVPWGESARAIRHPRSFWAKAGIRQADGRPLPGDSLPASLILPMGRLGPAFLAYDNFGIFWKWNQSSNYTLAAAYFATRLAGAPALDRGHAPAILSAAEMKEVQQRLRGMGVDGGEPDGRLGETTRDGVKKAQARFGLPQDGYPTAELLAKLRSGR
ncbi:lytic murein transglycosylase [Faunimonas pinastri]|uniref:Lytic murein transglycosylase n=1 Tax=Faunimonas pinastri TaxID=1855383 RepID=A0A1H9KTK6_9HYPH|nr:lytic murein transglycosylase [Faunimonas pinastri]SER02369.1 lytic murein transglycosylase [Faunimonas pinastri]